MFCKSCGCTLDENAKFCVKCGTAVDAAALAETKKVFCKACGSELEDGMTFCCNCGAPVQDASKEKIIGKKYIFKNNGFSRYVLDYFLGSEAVFTFQETELSIVENRTETALSKEGALFYRDITGFQFVNKLNIGQFLLGIVFASVGALMLWAGVESTSGGGSSMILGFLFLVLGLVGGIKNMFESVLVLNRREQKPVKIRLKKIRKKKIPERDAFCADLQQMIRS